VQAAGSGDRFAFLSLAIDPVRDDLRTLPQMTQVPSWLAGHNIAS
jgi:hypothetical protein